MSADAFETWLEGEIGRFAAGAAEAERSMYASEGQWRAAHARRSGELDHAARFARTVLAKYRELRR